MSVQSTDPSFPQLAHVANIRFELGETFSAGQTPKGRYVYVAIAGGHFNTTDTAPKGSSAAPLKAKILPGGSDYARVNQDGSFNMEVSTAAQGINVPDMFHITSHGYMAPGLGKVPDLETAFGDLDGWHSIRVNTNSEDFGWLNNALLFGQERIIFEGGSAKVVELRVFRVTVQKP